MNSVYLGGITGTKDNQLKWSKIRAGKYIAKVGDYFLVITQIKATNVETTGWWTTSVYNSKGDWLEELENYITLTEAKFSAKENFDDWYKYNVL